LVNRLVEQKYTPIELGLGPYLLPVEIELGLGSCLLAVERPHIRL